MNKLDIMEYIVSQDSSGNDVKLSYQDYGTGDPVILIHGWPLSKEMWEYQISDLVSAGYRVITYDRRGFGKSSKPWNSYDYDTLADDLNTIITQLILRNITLVGFSMGGGEVARYFSKYEGIHVNRIVLISSILPFLLQTEDHPGGVPQEIFETMAQQIQNDRIGFLEGFGKEFFGVSPTHHPISSPLLEYYRELASAASPRATLKCAESFSQTDFRKELPLINVPTLLIHGTKDKTVPINATSKEAVKLIPKSKLKKYEGAPHGLWYTHREELNKDLLDFLSQES